MWLAGGLAVSTVANLAVLAVAALLVDGTSFGRFVLWQTLVALAAVFGRLGLGRAALAVVGETDDVSPAIRSVLTVSIGASMIVGLIAAGIGLAVDGLVVGLITFVWVFGEGARLPAAETFRAQGLLAPATILGDAGRVFLALVLVTVGGVLTKSTTGLALGAAAASGITAVAAVAAANMRSTLRASASARSRSQHVNASDLRGQTPNQGSDPSGLDKRQPTAGTDPSGLDQRQPTAGSDPSGLDQRQPTAGSDPSGLDQRQPTAGSDPSGLDQHQPNNSPSDPSGLDQRQHQETAKRGLSMIGLEIQGVIQRHATTWLAATFLSLADAGVFTLAARAAFFVGLIMQAEVQYVGPAVVASADDPDPDNLSDRLAYLTLRATAAAAIVGLGIIIVAPIAIGWLSDDVASGLAIAIAVLVIGQIINVATGPGGQVLTLRGHPFVVQGIGIAAVIVLVLGGGLGAWAGGFIGLAIASAISTAGRNLMVAGVCVQRLGVDPRARLVREAD